MNFVIHSSMQASALSVDSRPLQYLNLVFAPNEKPSKAITRKFLARYLKVRQSQSTKDWNPFRWSNVGFWTSPNVKYLALNNSLYPSNSKVAQWRSIAPSGIPASRIKGSSTSSIRATNWLRFIYSKLKAILNYISKSIENYSSV